MDWTEPPTELDAMGFYSGCLVFGDDQIARCADRREMLMRSLAAKSCVLGSCVIKASSEPPSEADDDRFHLRESFNARCSAFEPPARLLVTTGWR
jgi:hypothetical protein